MKYTNLSGKTNAEVLGNILNFVGGDKSKTVEVESVLVHKMEITEAEVVKRIAKAQKPVNISTDKEDIRADKEDIRATDPKWRR